MTITGRLMVLAALTWIAVVGLGASAAQTPVPLRQPLKTIPLVLGEWSGHTLPPFDDATAAVLKADDYVSRSYGRSPGEAADLYIGYYERQTQGDTIHSPMNCLPAAGWQPLTIGHTEIRAGDTRIRANRYVVQKGIDKRIVVYWYQSHGRAEASEYWSRAYLALDALRRHRTDAALVRVITPVRGDEALAERNVVDFIRTLVPVLATHLPE
jgi:EpsI family protein